MLRGCILSLGLYVALAVGYFTWLDTVFEPPGTYIGAGVVGLIVLCCLAALSNARTALRTWSLVSSARHALPPRDGELVGITGTIHPVGEPLIAPFSGAECVVCEYDLASQARVAAAEDQQTAGSDYAGFLMTPCVIRSPAGDVRLLGFPILEGFGEIQCNSYPAARNARKFLTSDQFEDRAGLKFVTVLSIFDDVWSGDDGLVQKNVKLSKADPREIFPPEIDGDLARLEQWEAEHPDETAEADDEDDEEAMDEGDEENEEDDDWDDEEDDDSEDDDREDDDEYGFTVQIPKMTEKRVAVGEQVCAIGVYNETRRGLLPPAHSLKPNRLIRGSADQIGPKSWSLFFRNLVGSLVTLAIVHAAIFGVMQAYLHSLPKR